MTRLPSTSVAVRRFSPPLPSKAWGRYDYKPIFDGRGMYGRTPYTGAYTNHYIPILLVDL